MICDLNEDDKQAPDTDVVCAYGAQSPLQRFSSVKIDVRDFVSYSFRNRVVLNRERFLKNVGHIFGLDLYVTKIK